MKRNFFAATTVALAIATLSIISVPCFALSAHSTSSAVQGVPYTYLGTLYSVGPTTRDAFALAVSPYLHGYAEKHNKESCGEIARNADHRYALVWGTNHSHVGCIIPLQNVPTGFVPFGATIHAHPVRNYYYSRIDVRFGVSGGAVGERRGTFIFDMGADRHFSERDYESGRGYLATPNGAIFQNGSASSVAKITVAPCAVVLRQRTSHYLASL